MAELSKGKDNLKEREFDKKIFETSDSGDVKYISSDEESFISASFAKGDHVQNTNTFHVIAPIMYQLKLMQDEIDNLREFISTELATTSSMEPVSSSCSSVSTSFASTSRGFNNLPTSPIGLSSGDLYILSEKDKTRTIKMV
jgi:hypothetical protein